MILKLALKGLVTSLGLLLVFSSHGYASEAVADQSATETPVEAKDAIFKNPRKHRTSSSVFAIRIDGRRVRLGKELNVTPGVHRVDLVFNGQRESFQGHLEFEFEPGVSYRPKYRRIDRKGLEHIVLKVINVETKKTVAKTKPYLPRYSRRSVSPQH